MTDRDKWGLRGRVRSCRLERIWYSRQCGADVCETEERGDATTLEFRPNGALASQIHNNPDGSHFSTTHEYDEAGRLATTRTENSNGVSSLNVLEYDFAGRLLRILSRNGEGEDRILETYEYDSSGCKRKTQHIDTAAQRPDTLHAWGVEGSDSAYSAPGAAQLTTFYNERDQPIHVLFSDAAGRELSRIAFRYDEAGRLVEEAQTNSVDVLPAEMLASLNPAQLQTVQGFFGVGKESIRRTFVYDVRGRRVETHVQIGPLPADSKTVAYNDYGDPILEISDHEDRDVGIDEEGQLTAGPIRESSSRSETRLQYDYDFQGNWVLKKVEGRSGAEDEFILAAVERRAITYFV